MLSERERMSLREIESALRADDDGFVQAFGILDRVAGSPGPTVQRPVRARTRVARADRPLWRAVRLALAVVVLVAMLLLASAVLTGVGGVAALMVILGGTLGVMLFLGISAARARPR